MNYGIDPDDQVLKILNEDHYYPFGLKHRNYNPERRDFKQDPGENLKIKPLPAGDENPYKYKYNGKEWQDELGLNVYDYGARNYDPAIGRFFNLDPKAEDYLHQTPYAMSVNNPVVFRDINGEGVDTDYKVISSGEDKGKMVRVDPNDGTENDKTDRVFSTDKKGNVKNLEIENVAKGIITENMNMRKDENLISLGGENQPSQEQVENFLVQFSEKIANVEISAYEGITKGTGGQKAFWVNPYKDNGKYSYSDKLMSFNTRLPIPNGLLYITAHYHTHPYNSNASDYLNIPSTGYEGSDTDSQERRNAGKNTNLPHYILNKNGKFPY